MKTRTSKTFRKQYAKLSKKQQEKVSDCIRRFKKDPFERRLRNHALKGLMNSQRSISAGGDLRLIFEEYENYTLVLFLDVGSHNQVY